MAGGTDIRLRPWTDDDLPLLRQINAPEMTTYLGGPETEEKVLTRHRRYVGIAAGPGPDRVFVVETGTGEAVGSIAYWALRWDDQDVLETGWSVLPAHQGRGLATAAIGLAVEQAATHTDRPALVAFPKVDNAASNAICRKAGFTLLGERGVEYPAGNLIRVNHWRLPLTRPAGGGPAFERLHHMQLAMPPGEEAAARAFFVDVLGMTEIAKPPVLAARGGAWFRAGGVELHLGVEPDFRPATKGHPGILVDDLDAVVARLAAAGQDLRWDIDFPGFRRIYAADPFGNRLEFLQALP